MSTTYDYLNQIQNYSSEMNNDSPYFRDLIKNNKELLKDQLTESVGLPVSSFIAQKGLENSIPILKRLATKITGRDESDFFDDLQSEGLTTALKNRGISFVKEKLGLDDDTPIDLNDLQGTAMNVLKSKLGLPQDADLTDLQGTATNLIKQKLGFDGEDSSNIDLSDVQGTATSFLKKQLNLGDNDNIDLSNPDIVGTLKSKLNLSDDDINPDSVLETGLNAIKTKLNLPEDMDISGVTDLKSLGSSVIKNQLGLDDSVEVNLNDLSGTAMNILKAKLLGGETPSTVANRVINIPEEMPGTSSNVIGNFIRQTQPVAQEDLPFPDVTEAETFQGRALAEDLFPTRYNGNEFEDGNALVQDTQNAPIYSETVVPTVSESVAPAVETGLETAGESVLASASEALGPIGFLAGVGGVIGSLVGMLKHHSSSDTMPLLGKPSEQIGA